MNERQQNIFRVLRDRSPRLAGMYHTALQTLETPAKDGYESARISVICHCMRELMMGLQTVMIENPIERVKPSSGEITKGLQKLVERHPELDLGADQDLVPVPKPIAEQFLSLVGAAQKEYGRNRDIAAALVTAGTDRNHPAVKQWLDVYNSFFVRWAHIDSHGDRELPSNTVLLASIKIVEDVIDVRTTDFFKNLRSVEGMLAQINAHVEEDAS